MRGDINFAKVPSPLPAQTLHDLLQEETLRTEAENDSKPTRADGEIQKETGGQKAKANDALPVDLAAAAAPIKAAADLVAELAVTSAEALRDAVTAADKEEAVDVLVSLQSLGSLQIQGKVMRM